MKGYRTLRLQQALNLHGADISEDGEFGEKTQAALKDFQTAQGRKATGETDLAMLNALGLNAEAKPLSQSTGSEPSNQNPILVGRLCSYPHWPREEIRFGDDRPRRRRPTRHRRGRLESHPAGRRSALDQPEVQPGAERLNPTTTALHVRKLAWRAFLLLGADEPSAHSPASNRRMISHEVSGSRSNSARASSLAAICQAKWRRGTDRKRRANNAFSRIISSSCPRRAHIS